MAKKNKMADKGMMLVPVIASAMGMLQATNASDFSHAQKIFVPASRIDRRLDYDSLRARAAGDNFSAVYGSSGATSREIITSRQASRAASSSGLVPPPPAIPVPISAGGVSVPPPPPSPPISLDSATSPAPPGKGSKVKQKPESVAAAQARAKAQRLTKEGKLEDADLILRSAHKADPKDSLVNGDLYNLSVLRARRFLSAKHADSAAKAAREALYLNASSTVASDLLNQALKQSGINPFDSTQRLKLADRLAAEGRDTGALVEYKSSLKLKATSEAHVGIGNMELRAGHKGRAQQEYEQGLELDSNSGPAHRQLGLLKQSSGDAVGANTDLTRALVINPKDAVAGKALIELWQKQVAKSPGSANSHLGLARAYHLTGDLRAAQAEYREVVRIDPQHPNLPACRQSFKLALARQDAGRALEAAHTLEGQGAIADACGKVNEALSLCPFDPAALAYQGHLLEKLGQYKQARDAYISALRAQPNNAGIAQKLQSLAPLLAGAGVPGMLTAPVASGAAGNYGLAAAGPLSNSAPAMPGAAAAGVFGQASMPAAGALGGLAGLAGMAAAAPPQAFELPPSPTIPAAPSLPGALAPAPGDHVAALSNFLSQLRNQTVLQQKQDQALERDAHAALDRFLQPAASSGNASAAASAGTGSGADDLVKTLATNNPAVSPLSPPVVKMPDLSQFGLGKAGSKAPAPPSIASSDMQRLATAAAGGQAIAPVSGAASAIDPLTYQRLLYAEQQNRLLGEQLMQTQQLLQQMQIANANGNEAGDINRVAPPSPSPEYFAQAPAGIRGGQNFSSPVRLELEKLTPTASGVALKVVLSNDGDAPLPLKKPLDAVVRNSGSADMTVKVSFPDKKVPAHGKVYGLIKIPTRQISPNADLFLPNLLPDTSPNRDVHLTASQQRTL